MLVSLVFSPLYPFLDNVGSLPLASASFNALLNYQAKLTNASNSAVADSSYNLKFRLYTTVSGGSPIWTETWCYSPDSGTTCNGSGTDNRIPTVGGLFSTLMGSTTPFTGVDFNQDLYLTVEVGGSGTTPSWDGEMLPRKKLGAVPAAFVADTLNGISSSQFLRSDTTNSTSSATTFVTLNQTGAGNVLDLKNGSTNILNVTSGGKIGIGTTSPYRSLSVSGSSDLGNNALAGSFTATSTTASTFPYASTTALTVSGTGGLQLASGLNGPLQANNGLVSATTSIGVLYGGTGLTTAPSYGQLLLGNASSGYTLSATSSLGLLGSSTVSSITASYVPRWTGSYFSNSLIYDDTSNIGIGTSTPSTRLHVWNNTGNTLATIETQTANTAAVVLKNNSQAWQFGLNVGGGSGEFSIYDQTTGIKRLVADTSGRIGIGTTSPYAELSVHANANSTFNRTLFSVASSTATATTTHFVVMADGKVGFGTSSPSSDIDIANSKVLKFSNGITYNALDLNNNNIIGINNLYISDPGSGEGIGFQSTAANWYLDVSPLDRSNADGNFNVYGTANNFAVWRPQLWVYNGSTYVTASSTKDAGIAFNTAGSSTNASYVTFNGFNGFGIATTSPFAKLSVAGDAYLGGNVTATGTLAVSGATTLSSTLSVTGQTTLGYASTTQIGSTGSAYFATSAGNVGIGTTTPYTKFQLSSGDMSLSYASNYGVSSRYNGLISIMGGLKGRQINNNPDFLDPITNNNSKYTIYDNGSSGSITLSLISDDTAPSASGRTMQIDHTASGSPSPGIGGFYKSYPRCTGTAVGQCYREGSRIVDRVWAKIPVGFNIAYSSNATGNNGNHQWITPTAGTGNWEEYIGVQTIGIGGSLSTTGYWYLNASTGSRPTTWWVASLDLIDVDQVADVDRASKLNVGYKQDMALGTGSLLTTASTYLAVDSGNVAIGTSSPLAKLDVAGTNNGTVPLFQLSSVSSYATTTRLIVSSSGSLGIGTTTPGSLFSVQGNGLISGNLNLGSLVATGTVSMGTTTVTNLIVTNTSTSTFTGGINVHSGTFMLDPSIDTIGIGTTPVGAKKLSISQTQTDTTGYPNLVYGAYTVAPSSASTAYHRGFFEDVSIDATNMASGVVQPFGYYANNSADGTISSFVGINSDYDWGTARNVSAGTVYGVLSGVRNFNAGTITNWYGDRLQLTLGGGTVTTARGLSVAPTINSGSIGTFYGIDISSLSSSATNKYGINIGAFSGGTNNYGIYLGSMSGGTNNYAIYSAGGDSYFAGDIGIGTTSPGRALSVVGSSDLGNNALAGYFTATTSTASVFPYASTTGLTISKLYDSANSLGTNGMVLQTSGSVATWVATSTLGFASASQIGSGTQGQFPFYNSAGTNLTATSSIFLSQSGNIGIGQINPTDKLQVTGGGVTAQSLNAIGSPSIYSSTGGLTLYHTAGVSTIRSYGNSGGTGSTDLALITGGSERFRITSTGNIGIGTSSPFTELSVAGDAYLGGNVTATGTLTIAGATTLASTLSVTGQTTLGYASTTQIGSTGSAYFATSAGSVGIGTTSPALALQVLGVSGLPAISGTSQNGTLRLGQFNQVLDMGVNNGTGASWLQSTKSNDLSANYALLLNPNGGNVGIGTTSPSGQLHVSKVGTASIYLTNQNGAGDFETQILQNYNSASCLQVKNRGSSVLNYACGSSSNALGLFTNNTERLSIINNGNVGIGTTSPFAELSVAGDAYLGGNVTATGTLAVSGATTLSSTLSVTGQTTLGYASTTQIGSTGSAYFVTSGTGNVGIGTASPGALLDVQGAAQFGSGNVNLIDSTGKIAGISSTYFASLDGSTLTNLNASNLSSGTVPSARLSGTSGYYSIDPVMYATNEVHSTLGSATIGEMALSNAYAQNKLQFVLPISIEYTTDGTTWLPHPTATTSTAVKNMFLGYNAGSGITILGPNNGNWLAVRFVWAPTSYSYLNDFYVYNSTNGHTMKILIEKSYGSDDTTWSNVASSSAVSTWPGHSMIPHSTIAWNPSPTPGTHSKYVRVTFTPTWNGTYPDNNINLYNIDWWGQYPANTNPMQLFTWNFDKDVTFTGGLNSHNVLYVDSSTDNVGISDSSPTYKLDVTGNSRFTSFVDASYFVATSTSATSTIAGGLNVHNNTLLVNLTSDKVGIGTSSPLAKLSVAGDSYLGGNVTATGTLSVTGQTTLGYASTTQIGSTGSAYFATSAGSVGIGTTTPSQKLTVVGGGIKLDNNQSIIWRNAANNADVSLLTLDSNNAFNIGGTGSSVPASLKFFSAQVQRMVIDSSGNVGIGTSSPWASLSVEGTSTLGNSATAGYFIATSTTATSTFAGGLTAGGSGGTGLNVLQNGTVGIGSIPSGGTKLDVNGEVRATTGKFNNIQNRNTGNTVVTFGVSNDAFGIGTTSPFAKLSVAGDTYLGGNLTATGTLAVSGATTLSSTLSVTGNTTLTYASTTQIGSTGNAYFATTAGSVGIGTTSPIGILDVANQGATSIFLTDNSQVAGSKSWGIRNSGVNFQIISASDTGSALAAPITITRTGTYVGIGSTTPSSKLSVLGDSYLAGTLSLDGGNFSMFKSSPFIYITDTSQGTDLKQFQIRNENQLLKFVVSNDAGTGMVSALSIDRSGYIGLSSTTPSERLSVSGNAYITGSLDFATQKNIKFVFEGDSMSNDATDWPGLLVAKSGFFGRATQINVATAGETTSQMVTEFNTEVLPNAPARDSDEGYFFILGGTNDLIGGASASTIYANLKSEWQSARANKFKVVAFTVLPSNSYDAAKEAERVSLNKMIMGDQSYYDYLIRTDAFFNNPSDTTYFMVDGIHLNTTASGLLADMVYNAIYKNPYMVVQNGATTTMSGVDLSLNPFGGNVGIGTTSPYAKLSVVGQIVGSYFTSTTTTASTFPYASTTQISSTGNSYFATSGTGNVGIGTTTPSSRLQVDVSTSLDGIVLSNGGVNIGNLTYGGTGTGGALNVNDSSGNTTAKIRGYALSGVQGYFTAGNIGIGTTTPGALLDVNGGNLWVGDSQNNARSIEFRRSGITIGGISSSNSMLTLWGGTTPTTHFQISSAGNIGIASTSPWALFSINPNLISGPSFAIGSSTMTQLLVTNAGNVIVGTSSANGGNGGVAPQWALSVANNPNLSSNTTLGIVGSAAGYTNINLNDNQSGGVNFGIYNGYPVAGNFTIRENGVADRFTVLKTSGNIGIGTTSPFEKLSVAGDAYIGGNLIATGTLAVAGATTLASTLSVTGQTTLGYASTTQIGSTGSAYFVTSGTGNVGIGTTNPGYKLEVSGDIYSSGNVKATGFQQGYIVEKKGRDTWSADATAWKTIAQTVISDIWGYSDMYGSVFLSNDNKEFAQIGFYVHFRSQGDLNTDTPLVTYSLENTDNAASFQSYPAVRVVKTADVNGGNKTYEIQVQAIDSGYGLAGWDINYDSSSATYTHTVYSTFQTANSPLTSSNILNEGNKKFAKNLTVDGKVGIATTSPFAKLSVAGDAYLGGNVTATGTLAVSGVTTLASTLSVTGQTTLGYASTTQIGSTGSAYFVTSGTGNVGIGTTSPVAKLSVSGNSWSNSQGGGFIVADSSSTGAAVTIDSTGTSGRRYSWLSTASGASAGAGKLALIDNTAGGGYRMIIDSSGNMGIGTTSPAYKLDAWGDIAAENVAGSNIAMRLLRGGTEYGTIYSLTSDNNFYVRATQSSGALNFQTGGSNTRMTLDSSGNVGIGTTTPTSLLNIAGATAPKITLTDTDASLNQKHWFIESDTGSFNVGTTSDSLSTNTTYRALSISSSGNVGVGSSTPYGVLSVSGNGNSRDFVLGRQANGNTYFGISAPSGSNAQSTFYIANTAIQTLTSAGYVGIGTSTPNSQFVVWNGDNTGAAVRFSPLSSGNNRTLNIGGNTIQTLYSNSQTTGGDLILEGSGGNVGIGTSTPSAQLEISASASGINDRARFITAGGVSNRTLDFDRSLSSSGWSIQSRITNSDLGANLMINPLGGNVGIGTTSPFSALSIAGSAYIGGNITATGTLTAVYASTTATTVSSALYNTYLTSGRMPYTSTNGLLTDSSGLTFDSTNNTISISSSGANPTIYNPTSGNGIILKGDTSGGQLRIVSNTGGWADGLTTTYFQAKNGTNNNLSFMGGTYGADAVLDRLQFNASSTQITDLAYTGTAVPGALFSIQNSSASKRITNIIGASGQTADYLDITANGGTNGAILSVTSAGNMGISTSTPSSLLTINNSGTYTNAKGLQISDGTKYAYLYQASSGGTINLQSSSDIMFSPSGTEAVRLSSGKMGVGTSSPGQKLDVYGGNIRVDASSGTGYGLILRTAVQDDASRSVLKFDNNSLAPIVGDDHANQAYWFMSGWNGTRSYDAQMRVYGKETAGYTKYIQLTHDGSNGYLTSAYGHLILTPTSGNVGIATNTPGAKLAIEQAGTTNIGLYVAGYPGATSDILRVSSSTATATGTALVVSSSGLVGIGTSSPESLLDVDGLGTFGTDAATTAQLVVKGGSGGGAMVTLKRTVGTAIQYSWALGSGGLSFTDDTNGYMTANMFGDNTINQLYIGQRGNTISNTRVSLLSGTTFSTSAGTDVPGTELRIQGGLGTGAGTPGDLTFYTGTTLGSGTTAQSGAQRLTVKGNTGYVGIASSSPTAMLTVTNSGSVDSFIVEDQASPDPSPFRITASGAVFINASSSMATTTYSGGTADLTIFDSDNTGSNTTGVFLFDPAGGNRKMSFTSNQIQSNFYNTGGVSGINIMPQLRNNTDPAGNGAGVGIGTTTNNWKAYLSIQGTSTSNTIKAFDVWNSAGNETLVYTDAGRLGLGTTTPMATLSVAGNAYIGGSITATGTLSVSGQSSLAYASTTQIESTSSAYFITSGTGSVGIASTSPSARLSVNGGGTSTGRAFAIADSSNTERFLVLDNGNVSIGTSTTQAPYLFTINSTSTIEKGNLGGELTDATGWTSTNWTGSYGAGFTHTSGNTSPLSRTVSISAGAYYQISFTLSSTGSFSVGLGYATTTYPLFFTGTNTIGLKTISSSGDLTFTPSSSFNGTISNISVKKITAYNPTQAIVDSTGASSIEIRSSTASLGNSFIGVGTGAYNMTGYSNTGTGFNSLSSNTTGRVNTATGYRSLYSNTIGNDNTADGAYSLYSNTTGYLNSSFGEYSLYSNTSGLQNTAVGSYSMYNNTTSDNNTAIGYNTMYSNTTGASNTVIGSGALPTNITGSHNIVIGDGADNIGSNDSNSIVIGSGAVGLGSNSMVLGNSSIATTTIYGNVGIGTTSPLVALHIGSAASGKSVRIANGYLCVDTNDTCSAGSTAGTVYAVNAYTTGADLAENYKTNDETLSPGEIVSLDNVNPAYIKRANQGDVVFGVISTKPGVLLGMKIDNSKPVALTGRVPLKVNNEGGNINIGDKISLSAVPGVGKKASSNESVVGIALEVFSGSTGTIEIFMDKHAENMPAIITKEDGKVGIGTNAPAYKLHVIGDVAATSFINISTRTAKKDITYLSDESINNALTVLKTIKIANYRYNEEDPSSPKRLGLIAEEAPEEILSVGGKGVDIYKLATFTIAAVQAQEKRIDSLEIRLKKLEGEVASVSSVTRSMSTSSMTISSSTLPAASSTEAMAFVRGMADSIMDVVISSFNRLGVVIADGFMTVKGLAVETLKIGSKEKPTGITMFDDKNGNPYCFKISDGKANTLAGECAPIASTTPSFTYVASTPELNTNNSNLAVSTSTTNTSTVASNTTSSTTNSTSTVSQIASSTSTPSSSSNVNTDTVITVTEDATQIDGSKAAIAPVSNPEIAPVAPSTDSSNTPSSSDSANSSNNSGSASAISAPASDTSSTSSGASASGATSAATSASRDSSSTSAE